MVLSRLIGETKLESLDVVGGISLFRTVADLVGSGVWLRFETGSDILDFL